MNRYKKAPQYDRFQKIRLSVLINPDISPRAKYLYMFIQVRGTFHGDKSGASHYFYPHTKLIEDIGWDKRCVRTYCKELETAKALSMDKRVFLIPKLDEDLFVIVPWELFDEDSGFIKDKTLLKASIKESIVVYALLLHRLQFSIAQNCRERDKTLKIYYTIEQLQEQLGVSNTTIIKYFNTLDMALLVERQNMGKMNASVVYLPVPYFDLSAEQEGTIYA